MMIIKIKKYIYAKWDFYEEAHVTLKNKKSPFWNIFLSVAQIKLSYFSIKLIDSETQPACS